MKTVKSPFTLLSDADERERQLRGERPYSDVPPFMRQLRSGNLPSRIRQWSPPPASKLASRSTPAKRRPAVMAVQAAAWRKQVVNLAAEQAKLRQQLASIDVAAIADRERRTNAGRLKLDGKRFTLSEALHRQPAKPKPKPATGFASKIKLAQGQGTSALNSRRRRA